MFLETQPNEKGDEPIQAESDDESDESHGQNEKTETPIIFPSTPKTTVRRGKRSSKNVTSVKSNFRMKRTRQVPNRLKYI